MKFLTGLISGRARDPRQDGPKWEARWEADRQAMETLAAQPRLTDVSQLGSETRARHQQHAESWFATRRDVRYSGVSNSFSEQFHPTSISPIQVRDLGASGQSNLRQTIASKMFGYGLVLGFDQSATGERTTPIFPRQEEIRLGTVSANGISFKVMDRQNPNRVRASGTIELQASGSGYQATKLRMDCGSLQRVSAGFPGNTRAAQEVGGVIQQSETQAIRAEMNSRGLIVSS